MKIRVCPICSATDKKLLFNQKFSEFSNESLLKSYDVVSCLICGFCYANLIPEQSEFDSYYKNLSKYENIIEDEFKESKYDFNRFQILSSFFKDFITSNEAGILEIGCSTGMFLFQLKTRGYSNLTGVDPSPTCSVIAQKYYDINVITNNLSDFHFLENTFDCVILIGVLEHVKDLKQSINRIRKILKPKGIFFIAVPDASEYFNGSDAPFQEFSVEHINFFGPQSMDNLMFKCGFQKVAHKQVLIEVNYNTITPALMSVFSKDEQLLEVAKILKDQELVYNLELYIEKSIKHEKKITNKIQGILDSQSDIVIWGTGTQTLRLLANTKLSDAKIKAFVDSNQKYQGKTLNNIPVIAPREMMNRKEKILISTRPYQDEIAKYIINDLKLTNEIIKLY